MYSTVFYLPNIGVYVVIGRREFENFFRSSSTLYTRFFPEAVRREDTKGGGVRV